MGLDMYFYARKKEQAVGWNGEDEDDYKSFSHWDAEKERKIDETNYPEDLEELGDYIYRTNFKSSFINDNGYRCYQIGYFRKFNALHSYLCDLDGGRDECQEILVSKKDLTDLLDTLKAVDKNHVEAEDLLPTQDGFFFGGTEYDDWYFADVKDAIEMCELFLEHFDFERYDLIYQASW